MTECRHGNVPEECYLCLEEISAQAASLGRRGGEARKFSLSDERRSEIARLAARQRWNERIWHGVRVYKPMSAEKREQRRQVALKKFEGVPTKKKAILAELQAHTLSGKTQTTHQEAHEIAKKVGCSVEHVKHIAAGIGLFTPMSRKEVAQRALVGRLARVSVKDTRIAQVKRLVLENPNITRAEIFEKVPVEPGHLTHILKSMGIVKPRPPKVTSEDEIIQDASIEPLMRNIRKLVHRNYRIPRIAQLLDLPERQVRAYIKALPNYRFTRTTRGPSMTTDDVQKAYELWKTGKRVATIAKMLGFRMTQVQQRLLPLLRSLGEA